MNIKPIALYLLLLPLSCLFIGCDDEPEFNITQNVLFLVGEQGLGKSWRLVRAEIPVELHSDPSPVIYNILQHPEFNCYHDDTLTFFLQDSLWMRLGETACRPLFDEAASNRWLLEENRDEDSPDVLTIGRRNQNLNIEYSLPISLLNRERLISDLVLPLNRPILLNVDGVEVEIFELDLTLEFESLDEP